MSEKNRNKFDGIYDMEMKEKHVQRIYFYRIFDKV